MSRQKLMDRVYLTCIPSEKFKTSFLSAQIAAPLEKETAGCNALMVNVLSRGTVRCPDMASIGRELDLLYGARLEPTVRKKGENQLFGFAASCIDDRFLPKGEKLLEKLTDLLGEFFCMPVTRGGRLLEEYVESERENLADMIRSDINDKRAYAARRLLEEMCAGERYGLRRMGSAGDVENISLQRLNRHYRETLPKGRLELFYCGSAPEKRVAGAFARAFAALPRQGALEPVQTIRRPARETCRVVTEELDVSQGKLALGFRTGGQTCWEEDYPALTMCNAIFGGTTLSKLFMNVREKLSLCYYASSMMEKMKGLVLVSSGIEFDKYQTAKDEILAQLEAIRRGDIEDWEMEGTRRTLIGGHLSTLDDQGRQEEFWLGQAAAGLDTTIEELVDQFENVTREQVAEAARRLELDTVYFLKGKEV